MQKDEIKHHNFAFLAFRGFYLDYLWDVPVDLKATQELHLLRNRCPNCCILRSFLIVEFSYFANIAFDIAF